MRNTVFSLLVLLAASTGFASTIPRLTWQLETSNPTPKVIALYAGETVDLECQVTSYQTPMDFSGAAVVLNVVTNGMPPNVSYKVTGSVGRVGMPGLASLGWVTVRINVNRDLPAASAQTWCLAVTQGSATLVRVTGTFTLSGTAYASGVAPTPSLSALEAAAVTGIVAPIVSSASSGTLVTAHTDAVSQAAMRYERQSDV